LVKLAAAEKESDETWFYAGQFQWVSSEVVVTEIPRAMRRKASTIPTFDLAQHLTKSEIILQEIALHPLTRLIMWRAARILDPQLGSLDAIHVRTALDARPIHSFVTYDVHQGKVARDAGLNVRSPGA
jgi:predicted nucleic acid-binding protein